MGRLTKAENGKYVHCNIDDECTGMCGSCKRNTEIRQKLKHYEDLEEQLESAYGECEGLLKTSVEHLVNLAHEEEIQEEIGQPHKARLLTDEHVDEWLEYKRLKEQGRLVILPCKVGDKVYVTERRVIKCKIKSIEFFECGISIKLMYAGENELLEHWKTSVTIDEFGEKVFFTKEEAEQALERRKNGNDD